MVFYLPYLHMLLPSTIRAQRTDATFLRIYLFESMVSKLLYVTNFSKVVFIWTEQHLLCSEKTRTHTFFSKFCLFETKWDIRLKQPINLHNFVVYSVLLYFAVNTGMILSRLKGASFKGAMVHYISKERRRSENDTWKCRWLQLQNVVLEGFVGDGAGFSDSGCLQLY